uniref:B double prime 1, subunit of RNA polymerase III transcription initiation factor IIIB n=1 Tax=Rousettus aegyptiacus TaxID=9407 RepID=A0A7J8EWZ6_ROUAE|nr:B double prime 1, subunit of RNA polymerase III transcription initiation factor IIIB [Rousettus aegyptiacus]
MLGLAWVPGPRLPPIPSVDKRLPGRRSLQRPLPRSQRTLQMCPRWISGERSPKKRLPGGEKKANIKYFYSG